MNGWRSENGRPKTRLAKMSPNRRADTGLKANDENKAKIDRLLAILNGEVTIGANMKFLIKNNHSDLFVLKTIRVRNC